MLSNDKKTAIKQEVVSRLRHEPEVLRIVVFGSFNDAPDPHDIDIAVFQDSAESYLPLAMKYRKCLRSVEAQIDVDIFPLRPGPPSGSMAGALNAGEVVYERGG
jgi:predicted nucleotidyltransferase